MGVTSSMACQSPVTSVPRKMRRMQRRKDAVMTPKMSRQWWWSGGLTTLLFMSCTTVCFLWIHVQYKCSLRKICMVISLLRCFESSGYKSIVSICGIHALLLVKQQDTCQSRQIEAELLLPRRVWKVQLSSQSTCRSC